MEMHFGIWNFSGNAPFNFTNLCFSSRPNKTYVSRYLIETKKFRISFFELSRDGIEKPSLETQLHSKTIDNCLGMKLGFRAWLRWNQWKEKCDVVVSVCTSRRTASLERDVNRFLLRQYWRSKSCWIIVSTWNCSHPCGCIIEIARTAGRIFFHKVRWDSLKADLHNNHKSYHLANASFNI